MEVIRLLWVISLRGRLGYSGPFSAPLAIVWVLGCLGVLSYFEGACHSSWAFFPFWLMFAPPRLVPILFGWPRCFSGEPRVWGALLIWSCSLVGRSLLIRDRELVFWFKFWFWAVLVFFRQTGGWEVVEADWSLE